MPFKIMNDSRLAKPVRCVSKCQIEKNAWSVVKKCYKMGGGLIIYNYICPINISVTSGNCPETYNQTTIIYNETDQHQYVLCAA